MAFNNENCNYITQQHYVNDGLESCGCDGSVN